MPVGPVLQGPMVVGALEFLESEHGLRLDRAVDPAAAHVLGRLLGLRERLCHCLFETLWLLHIDRNRIAVNFGT